MRDTALAPLPPEIRVLREAPTYFLCELALDAGALEALEALENADAAVAEAEEDVRKRLSRATADAAPELERSCALLGELDVLVARAAFAARHACVLPELATSDRVELHDARFPPLAEALAERGRAYVPISLTLEGLAVVTGPNMGGKTAALRTLGFAAACVTLGLPVPASFARIPLVDEIVWLGIGAAAPDAEDAPLLSAFGAEVVALRAFLERPARRALVLADEFARTTSPSEGRALLVALLEALRVRGALGLAATHLAGVAAVANVAHFAIGRLSELPPADGPLPLGPALERIAAAMDYALVRVDEADAGESGAIALAGALGLDAALVARAAEVMRSPENRES
jgi:DNA mismatch repair ATPase MutS